MPGFIAFLLFGAFVTIVCIGVICASGWVLQLLLPLSLFEGCAVTMGGIAATAWFFARVFDSVEQDVLWEKMFSSEEEDEDEEGEEELVRLSSRERGEKRKRRR